eukprot:scaffold31_cov171-Amphora_coffeaeformis.AAC.2
MLVFTTLAPLVLFLASKSSNDVWGVSSRSSCRRFSSEKCSGRRSTVRFNDESSLNFDTRDTGRRYVLGSLLVASSVMSPLSSIAQDTKTTVDQPDFSCLADLGPVPDDSVRVYACRHGQTENNRLRLVQGSRMDPPLNENGTKQAERLGKALAQASVVPTKVYHSPLLRARQTAETAAAQFATKPETAILDSIREIDFGPTSDGTSVEAAKSLMIATYSRWAVGDLDVRMASDGESGREVLLRVEEALDSDFLREATNSPTRCIAIVSHSSYLRTLLATIQNISLTNVATIEVKNASISVIDIKRDGSRARAGPKSRLFGGWLSRAGAGFSLSYPVSSVLRVNEKRHLGSLAL